MRGSAYHSAMAVVGDHRQSVNASGGYLAGVPGESVGCPVVPAHAFAVQVATFCVDDTVTRTGTRPLETVFQCPGLLMSTKEAGAVARGLATVVLVVSGATVVLVVSGATVVVVEVAAGTGAVVVVTGAPMVVLVSGALMVVLVTAVEVVTTGRVVGVVPWVTFPIAKLLMVPLA
jgi:hypothetical protein